MLTHLALAAILSAASPSPEPARSWVDPARCPMQVSLRALGSVASAPRNWKILHAHFQTYGQCDGGALADGYSQGVIKLLAESWPTLPDLAATGRADPVFLEFVLAHVDANASAEDLDTVVHHARSACPRRDGPLCHRIAGRAEAALEQLRTAQRR
jgi:hypothetical protein